MKDSKEPKQAPDTEAKTEGTAPADESPKDAPAKDSAPTAEDLRKKIEALEAELKEKDDKYLRMAAEYDNFRRRSREEKLATYDDAVKDTVTELLPIIDNLERAALYDDKEKVREGLAMTAKSVGAALKKLGVETFGEVGDTFNPEEHNAVMHIEDDEHKEGEIVDVFSKGYKKGKKIIRFAMVKTAN